MLDLPISTNFGRIIAKERICDHVGADVELREVFKTQVERIRWSNKISPATMNIAQGELVEEIQVVEITLRTPVPDKRLISAVRKAIPYKTVFLLVNGADETYVVYHDSNTVFSSKIPPKLLGTDTDSVWANFVIQIGEIKVNDEQSLDEQITILKEREILMRKIERLDKQMRTENQPRRKWDLNEELKKLRKELESHG
ncbi:MAG: DUF4391 domain-containing protein [Oscillospiraceae bacterium]|nr:DUF4391 domain-containing protein [Oscillospiraceae bacterium]